MADQQIDLAHVTSVMEDPSSRAVARTYADAFLDAIAATKADSALEDLGSFVDDVLGKVPDLNEVFFSRVVGRDEKINLIDKIVAPRAPEILTNFLRVLARHDRLDLLPAIRKQAQIQSEIRSGRQRVEIISARPLDSKAADRIRKRLAESLPFDPILEIRVDPSLIGGIVIRVGDTVYDSSLATRIKQLRGRLNDRSLHEVQSGRDRFSSPERD